MDEVAALQHELATQDTLVQQVRADLYSIHPRYHRSLATTALAGALAERTYRLADLLPDLQNETAVAWRGHLARVWSYLAGDEQQHYALSAAVAEFLQSPLNHIDGQDGPDDMDRPQIGAAYAAVLSTLHWAVDFAETAILEAFEAIDVKYDQEFPAARADDVRQLVGQTEQASRSLRADLAARRGISPELLHRLRG